MNNKHTIVVGGVVAIVAGIMLGYALSVTALRTARLNSWADDCHSRQGELIVTEVVPERYDCQNSVGEVIEQYEY